MAATIPPSNGKIALVSGINGYIASVIGLALLEKGYSVRGTARKASSPTTDSLIHGAYKDYAADRFEVVSVPDITAPGAFDEAVKGVHIILHTASPIDFSLQTLDEFMRPAIGGATGILTSALHHAGPQLAAVVVTSSVAAVIDAAKPSDYSFTEADWNESILEAAKTTPNAPGLYYAASKTAAEKAVWEWRDKNNAPFSLTAINPGVVTGPPVNLPPSPDALNATLRPIWALFSGSATAIPPGIGSQTYIDVRDVAAMHVWAAEHPASADRQRYLLAAGRGTMQAAADILRAAYPQRPVPVGDPGYGYEPDYGFPANGVKFYSRKAESALGRGLKGFRESVLDTVAEMRGYL